MLRAIWRRWVERLTRSGRLHITRKARTPQAIRLRLEPMEDRIAPSMTAVDLPPSAPSLLRFDAATGWLTLADGAAGTSVQVTDTADGAISLEVNGQAYSSDPDSPTFDPALVGATTGTLRGIAQAGGPADALTLTDVTIPGALSIESDGNVTLAGNVTAMGELSIAAASLDVPGTVRGTSLVLSATATISIDTGGGSIAATGDNGGTISLDANELVNTGDISASGTQGGSITVTAADYLNEGLVTAAGDGGPGGTISIDFSHSYIDTTAATTTVAGGTSGGQIVVDGGASGRLFASGAFSAEGATGGSIELLGQNVLLIGADANASGLSGAGGQVYVGGDSTGAGPVLPAAQTTEIAAATAIAADGGSEGVGGRVVVWSETNTDFLGGIEATGGKSGGYIEVSSHGQMTDGGTASAGKGGTLLFDPQYLVIEQGSGGTFPQFSLVNPGSGGAFGTEIVTLPNGNIVVTDPDVNSYEGAVYLFNGLTGALISTLTGSDGDDYVGYGGITVLTNGNYVVSSPDWNSDRGAATWGSETVGVSGVVSSSNSLTGSNSGRVVDEVSLGGVTPLSNGNYVVSSPQWGGILGAATWGNGTTGISGPVSSSNSLVGSTAGDYVSNGGVTALTNGNYVVSSPDWANYKGAATWGNGTSGTAGLVSTANSLVGSDTGYNDGDYVSSGGITALADCNYVVDSPDWSDYEGAVTWGTGSSGAIGLISSTNSLVGTTTYDRVGYSGVTALPNGNYVILSPAWNDGAGAVTWASGATGITGNISSSNSLVGSGDYDGIGNGGVTVLANDNFIVNSSGYGAVTWCNGAIGTFGIVSASNSLVNTDGTSTDADATPAVIALTNGNYVFYDPTWGIGAAVYGVVTWGNGTTGTTGTVGTNNSLIGLLYGSVFPLANGDFVVCSPRWSGSAYEQGAVTWVNGTTGLVGTVSASNSIVGVNADDEIGSGGATALANGDYVIKSPAFDNNIGAATWESGTGPVTGTVSASNSLVGSSAGYSGDQVSSGGVVALPDGNFVVESPLWSDSKGADTWGSGTTGLIGTVSSANSLVGVTGGSTGDEVGSGGVTVLADGNAVISSPNWNDAAGNAKAGAVTWMDSTTGTTLDGQNTPDADNSVLGTAAKDGLIPVQLGPINGSFVAAFPAEGSGVVTVGFVPTGGSGDGELSYGFDPTQTITEPPSVIAEALAAGTNVVLQANDDITINTPIAVTNPSATPGSLTLQAGRSILLNAGINTDGGNLTLTANDTVADGVVNADRDSGNAVIDMASGVILNTGGGNLSVDLKTSTDKTNNGKGVATLLGLTSNSVTLSSATTLGVTIDGETPGNGVTAGTYTQTDVTGPIDLNGATLVLTHSAATSVGEVFTIVQTTGGVTGTFAGLPQGATVAASDGTLFAISYQADGGDAVTLTQLITPTRLVVTTQPPISVAAGTEFGLSISVEDNQGDIATGYTGTVTLSFANNPGSAALGGTLTAAVTNGVATFSNLTLNIADAGYTLEAASASLASTSTSGINVVAGPAARLVIVSQPSSVTAGSAIAPAVAVAVEDAYGNIIASDNSTVTVSLATGPGTLGGETSIQASDGIASFSDLVLTTAGTDTLILTDTELPASSNSITTNSFTVSPASPHTLAFVSQPMNTTAGVAVSPAVEVEILDAYGNLLTDDNSDQISLAVASGPGGFAGGSTTAATVSGGIAAFSNLVLDTAGSYTLSPTGPTGTTSSPSNSFIVGTGAPDHPAFLVQPGNTSAGTAIDPSVEVEILDKYGNLLTDDNTDQVTLSIAGGPGGLAGGSTSTATASGGIATFNNLVFDTAGSYTLSEMTAGGLTGANSNQFIVSPAAPDHLAFAVQPANTTAGTAIFPAVKVEAFDKYDNLLTNDNTIQVSLNVSSGPSAFTVGSTTTVTASGGIAAFTNLVLDTAGNYMLADTATGGLAGSVSNSFTVSPGSPHTLVFATQPGNATAGDTISPPVQVELLDQYGNLLTTDNTDRVTLSVASGPGGFAAGSNTAVAVSGGIATFNNLALDTAGTYTISPTGPSGTTGSASDSFTISSGAPDRLSYSPPGSAVAGLPLGPVMQVEVVDEYGNLVNADVGDQVSVSIAGGPGGFASGSTTSEPVSGGIAAFDNLVLDTAGAYTVDLESGSGLSGAVSFQLSAAAPDRLAFSVQPGNTTAGSAIDPAVQVQVFDQFGNPVTQDNSDQVALTVASGSGGFAPGSTSAVTVVGGVATFSNLILDVAGDGYSLQAAMGSLPVIDSNSFDVVPGSPDMRKSGMSLSSGSVTAGSTSTVTLQLEDAYGNDLDTGGATVTFGLGAGTALGTFGLVTDNGNGTYTASFTGRIAGTNTVTATVNGALIQSTAPEIAVTPGQVNLAVSTVQLSAGSVASGNSITATLQADDFYGNAVILPLTVGFVLGGGNATGTWGEVTDLGGGLYAATFTGYIAGTNTIIATIDNQNVTSSTPAIAVTPGQADPANSVVTMSTDSISSGSDIQVSVQSRDAAGNDLTTGGLTVQLELGNLMGGLATIGNVTDHHDGIYTVSITGTIAGDNTLVPVVDGQALTALPFSVSPGPDDPDNSIVSLSVGGDDMGAYGTVQAGGSAQLTLQAVDASGNDLASGGLDVQFQVIINGAIINTLSSVDNGDGTYSAIFEAAGGETVTFQPVVNGQEAYPANTPTLYVIGDPVSTAKSLVSVSPASVEAGSTTTITLQAEDAKGHYESAGGLTVVFGLKSKTGGQGTFGPVIDNEDGTYTATFTGTLAGTNSITATIGNVAVTTKAPAVKVNPSTIDSASSAVTVSAANVKAGTKVSLTLQPKDAYGNKVTEKGQAVTFDVGTLTLTGQYQANGTYTASFTPTTVGTYPVTATIEGQAVTSTLPTVAVTPGTPNGTKSVLTASAQTVAVGGAVSIMLVVKDAYGNLETGELAVVFKTSGTGKGTFDSVAYLGNGVYMATFTAVAAGKAKLAATVAGVKVTTTPTLTIES